MPLQVQPQCFMALCLVSWSQILLYSQYVPDPPTIHGPLFLDANHRQATGQCGKHVWPGSAWPAHSPAWKLR